MAAVGSGGVLARATPSALEATFADVPTGPALVEAIGWARHASPLPLWSRWPGTRFGVLMFDGATILSRHGPLQGPSETPLGVPAGFTVGPVPRFPVRPAVPARSVQAMVFRHTRSPDVAAALVGRLASAEAQADLMAFDGALVLREGQARTQLGILVPACQGVDLIVSSAYDIVPDDAYGPRTDANSASRARIAADLSTAIGSLAGYGDYPFDFVRSFSGPVVERIYLSVPPDARPTTVPDAGDIAAGLQTAQRQANLGGTAGTAPG